MKPNPGPMCNRIVTDFPTRPDSINNPCGDRSVSKLNVTLFDLLQTFLVAKGLSNIMIRAVRMQR